MQSRLLIAMMLGMIMSGCLVTEGTAVLRETNARYQGVASAQVLIDEKDQKIFDLIENMQEIARNEECIEYRDEWGEQYLNIIC